MIVYRQGRQSLSGLDSEAVDSVSMEKSRLSLWRLNVRSCVGVDKTWDIIRILIINSQLS